MGWKKPFLCSLALSLTASSCLPEKQLGYPHVVSGSVIDTRAYYEPLLQGNSLDVHLETCKDRREVASGEYVSLFRACTEDDVNNRFRKTFVFQWTTAPKHTSGPDLIVRGDELVFELGSYTSPEKSKFFVPTQAYLRE